MLKEITLPLLGEKIDSADVASILVHEGESIHKEDPLLELESEKAVMDFPSPVEGIIREVKIRSGEKVKIGQVLFVVDTEESEKIMGIDSLPSLESGFTLQNGILDSDLELESHESIEPLKTNHPENTEEYIPVGAAPLSYRLARELGIDIHDVKGSGTNGFISKDDVMRHVQDLLRQVHTGAPAMEAASEVTMEIPDMGKWGSIRREPLSSVRKTTAMTLSQSVKLIPHVTQQDRSDITRLEEFRKSINNKEKNSETRISLTAILVKICALALRRFDIMNASFDAKNESVVYYDYVHIGVAVDTDRGLFVPVIRNADILGIKEISEKLQISAKKAREKKLVPDDMKGATFTITNLGGFGTGYFTPIISWPQSGILGTGKARMEPLWDTAGNTFKPGLILPISLTYDHRLIDGAYAARFSRFIAEALEEPANLLL